MLKTLKKPYTQRPLIELIANIVNDFDVDALNELHQNRGLFRYKQRKSLLLVDFLYSLSRSKTAARFCGSDKLLTEKAYDLTLAKFFEIPVQNSKGIETKGTDCRYYFRAFMNYFQNKYKFDDIDSLETELHCASRLQSFITRHFYFSCLECIRRQKRLYRRYIWRLDDCNMSLWMPTEMTGNMCRKWLTDNIPQINTEGIGEKDRIQQIIYDRLGRRKLISLQSCRAPIPDRSDYGNPVSESLSSDGLAELVSREKSEIIDTLNRKIASLGAEKLKHLINDIFENILTGRSKAADIACKYGIDKVTFSRFAGTKWASRQDFDPAAVPVLWKNTAGILAADDRFVEAAKSAGIWQRIEKIFKHNRESNHHE